MRFRVTIHKEGTGDEQRVVEAPTRFAVYAQIEQEGGTVTHIDEVHGFRTPKWLSMTIGTGVKRIEIVRMAKNLAAMLDAGLPISRALSVIERQTGNKQLRTVVRGISDRITKGSSFHEALGDYPKIFPPIFVAMMKAGEESGSLSESLRVVETQLERSEELAHKIRGAMIYPTIVIFAIIIVGVLMMIYVVPTLTRTFKELHVAVPLATRVITDISNFMAGHALLVLFLLALFIVGGITFVRSKPGGEAVLFVALRLPVIGELVRETYAARASRTLSSLLSSGVPVLGALSITEEVVRAKPFAKVIVEAEGRVKNGEALSAAFSEHTKLYPILLSEMLSVGEETGSVAEMLKQIAEFYENDVAEKTKDLSTIIEPVLMLLIGGVVGIFAISMIAPIYSLSSAF